MKLCKNATIVHCMSKAFITICCYAMCVGLFMGIHLHVISLKMNSAVKCHLFAHSNHKTNLFTYDYVRDCALNGNQLINHETVKALSS